MIKNPVKVASYHPYAFATIVFWALAYILTRLALRHFTPLSLGFLRYFVASCALVGFVCVCKIRPPSMADVLHFALSGAMGFFAYVIAFNKGSETVSASTSSVVVATAPIMTAFLARFLYGEKLVRLQWAAVALEFAGILILALGRGSLTVDVGIFWLLGAALSLSLYNLLQRKLTQRYTSLCASSYSIFAGTVMLAVFLPSALPELWHAPMRLVLCVVLLGLLSSAAAYVLWSRALQLAPNTMSVSNYMFLTPFLATIFGYLLGGERPDLPTLA
ncbi:DMT family transporter, partial [Synergistaceae bacterium OttesenSCG-928-I11]|nr:DMT family transporter [Synergistaceae bacterium OttesenSCG-928-I11]